MSLNATQQKLLLLSEGVKWRWFKPSIRICATEPRREFRSSTSYSWFWRGCVSDWFLQDNSSPPSSSSSNQPSRNKSSNRRSTVWREHSVKLLPFNSFDQYLKIDTVLLYYGTPRYWGQRWRRRDNSTIGILNSAVPERAFQSTLPNRCRNVCRYHHSERPLTLWLSLPARPKGATFLAGWIRHN